MSINLSPETIERARLAQHFVTLEFVCGGRLPLKPLASEVTWDPVVMHGDITTAVVLDGRLHEVDRVLVNPRPCRVRSCDAVTLVMSRWLTHT